MEAGCEDELCKLNEIHKLWSRNYLKEFCWLTCLSVMTVRRKLPTIPWLSPLASEDVYSRFFVVNSEANEISVIWRTIPFPRQFNPILQCCVGNKTQNVAFTCNTERHHRAELSLHCLIVLLSSYCFFLCSSFCQLVCPAGPMIPQYSGSLCLLIP